ncbi:DUF3224 domain-containing protein [Nocardiopsis gilva YIM 90087]|uniref:DUF3224 domain-containing protein n=1 Tax=Nocardiopsis gilva YIM 90087 TaxID=1235441 RepID=A0A223S2D3_9ACTN|nr:DUF3224 domain-containing protein [Nocardiopsis gilva]ASU82285.1 DUF3224 domain-containing protein [Nocardiopsis gilva YIM 90087]
MQHAQHTSGEFTFANWEENTVGRAADGPKLALASVVNTFSGGIEAAETTCGYTITYATENTGAFTGFELLQGTVDGRKGTFILEERGSFDADGSVHCTFDVVHGSATDELTGLTGRGHFTVHQGTPSTRYTFAYDLG